MSLNKLSDSTIKLISSAQVITSVSSVVKELIENSLDAESTNIEVKLENHGLKKIEVVDNGKGVSVEDAWNMCKKSYTSKIRNFEDLGKLGTYGFRGEALNSLCAVAKVSITTKTETDMVAMTYEFDNSGNVVSSKMSHVNKGTIVTVENLFENLPVRKQFLSNGKRKSEEIKKLEVTVKMLAVIHPKLRLVLSHNKVPIWQKSGVPNLRLSLMQAIAPTVVKQLVDLRHEDDQITFRLLIPEKGCNISSMLYKNPGEAFFLYINHRPVRDRNIEKIIQNEVFNYFGNDILPGKHPTCLVSIELPSDVLDVNLEPNKTRVILKDMDKVGKILRDKLVDYYVDSKSAEKRRNSDDEDLIEVKMKIPKIRNKASSPEKPIATDEKVSSEQSNAKDNNDVILDMPKKILIKSPEKEEDKKKIIADFMAGLESKFSTASSLQSEDKILPTENDKPLENSHSTKINFSSLKNTNVCEANNSMLEVSHPPAESTTKLEDPLPPAMNKTLEYSNAGESPLYACKNYFIASPVKSGNTFDDINTSKDPSSISSSHSTPLINDPSDMKTSMDQMDIDDITLSQWSRGDVKIGGTTIQNSITLLGTEKVPESCSENLNIVNIDYLASPSTSGTKDQMDETQASERSVSSQMGCKDMAGFTRYATEMTNKIKEESKGVSFVKVASELASQWRKLHDSEKELFNEKAKLKQKPTKIKERDNKGNASMRDQLQKFLAKCNEKKPLKRRNYPAVLFTDVTMGSIRKALERRVSQSVDSGVRGVGELSEDVKCAVVENTLYAFSVRRLDEALLFFKNLSSMIISYKVLETNIPINEGNLGESLLSILVSLETAVDARSNSIIISDSRITSNGLRIELTKDSSGICYFQITDVPLHIAFFGIDDLKEILMLIESSSTELPLEECRPLKVISFIRAETIRQLTRNNINPTSSNPFEKFKYWMNIVKKKSEQCPHLNCVFKILDVPKIV